jgi:hypothetical protein
MTAEHELFACAFFCLIGAILFFIGYGMENHDTHTGVGHIIAVAIELVGSFAFLISSSMGVWTYFQVLFHFRPCC